MTEELDRLRAALKSAPPAPDPAAKAQALARANNIAAPRYMIRPSQSLRLSGCTG